MKILFLGGTRFVGRHFVQAALDAGHELTLFHRGKTNPDLFPETEHLLGDREGDLAPLREREWDRVVDVSGYYPGVLRSTVAALAGHVGHYTFTSSISAYGDFSRPPITEDSPLAALAAHDEDDRDPESYGARKAVCERIVREAFGEKALIVRPGLVVGPFDPTGRFTYWPARISEGGRVLAPGDPSRRAQFIDARDLGSWVMHMVSEARAGVFNATGPVDPLTLGELLTSMARVLAADAELVWVPDDFLLEREVEPWTDLPLWIPAGEELGFTDVDCSRAIDVGLSFRPLTDTVRDTFDHHRRDGSPATAGISRTREAELLEVFGGSG